MVCLSDQHSRHTTSELRLACWVLRLTSDTLIQRRSTGRDGTLVRVNRAAHAPYEGRGIVRPDRARAIGVAG
jgi:hypothetical protein